MRPTGRSRRPDSNEDHEPDRLAAASQLQYHPPSSRLPGRHHARGGGAFAGDPHNRPRRHEEDERDRKRHAGNRIPHRRQQHPQASAGSRRAAGRGVNATFRGRAPLRVGVEHPAHHNAMNDRLRAGRSLSSEDHDDAAEEADTPQPWVGLDGGAGRGRSVDLRSTSQQMSDAMREASGRLPGTYGDKG